MFLIDNRRYWFMRFPFGLILPFLPITKKVSFYQKEINALWDKWDQMGKPRA